MVGQKEFFDSLNDPAVVLVDPLPSLQAAERDGISVYFANDGHLNPTGQERVAQMLLNAVSKINSKANTGSRE